MLDFLKSHIKLVLPFFSWAIQGSKISSIQLSFLNLYTLIVYFNCVYILHSYIIIIVTRLSIIIIANIYNFHSFLCSSLAFYLASLFFCLKNVLSCFLYCRATCDKFPQFVQKYLCFIFILEGFFFLDIKL